MLSDAKKNAIASYANTGVTAVAGLLTSPLLLHYLGPSDFGAWKAMQRLLDIGATAGNGGAVQSLKWVVAHRSRTQTDNAKRRDVGAALVVLLRWSPILLAVTATIVALLPRLIRDVNDPGRLIFAGTLLGLNLILATFTAVPQAVLIGTNNGFRSTNVSTAVIIFNNVGMAAAAFSGIGLTGMAAVFVIGTAINAWVTFLVARKRVGWWGVARPTRGDVRRLSGFSGWTFLWGIATRLSDATELAILSVLAGATAVSAYTFTGYAVLLAGQICWLTSTALAPRLGAFVGRGEWVHAQTAAREMRELTLALATGAGALIIILNESFVRLWANAEQFMGQSTNVLIVVVFVQYVIIFTDSKIQDTGLEIGFKVLFGALMIAVTLVAAAVVFTITSSVNAMLIAILAARVLGMAGFPILANRTINGAGWPVTRVVFSSVILAVSTMLAKLVTASNLVELVGVGLLGSIVLIPLVALTILSPATRRKLLSRA